MLFYYTGIKYRGTFNYIGDYPNGKTVPKSGLDPDTGAICLATLRRDGFISLDAAAQPGHVLTSVFTRPDGRLHVNANLRKPGRLAVEVLDESGRVIATSKPMEGDQPRGPVEWPADPGQASVGDTIQLRFTLSEGSLYSYWFAKSEE